MRPSSYLALLAPAALVAVVSAEPAPKLSPLIVNFDEKLEGRTGTYEKVEDVVGKLSLESKFAPNSHNESAGGEGGDVRARDATQELTARTVLDVLLNRRQYCNTGYGYCSSFGRCCPQSDRCCSYGYCLPPNTRCCPTGPCEGNKLCCGRSHCSPIGGDCCSDESYCEPGNRCYRVPSLGSRPVCCTNSRCTAVVRDGKTTYATTSTTTRTYTTTYSQYYYWTITYYYYYYYWTYSYQIEASVVTSTRRTTYTTLSVRTTDRGAASSYFSSVSQTLSLPTPAAATSLASLTGVTSHASKAADDTTDAGPSPTDASSDSGGGGDATASSASSAATTTTASGGGSGNNGGGGSSAASALWSQVDLFTTLFMAFGASVGVAAVLL
ncbi:hypothetical protein PLICBS_000899 [Purpureocillium lilacinum]|uniref:uncharacterized protein n=1 Tax=Purpureocillium lilacinum TaxID=33203 RepID=UPI00208A5B44|nr:hypothetical protein PLICBS_000899 [Purpureocillium lilacinum]